MDVCTENITIMILLAYINIILLLFSIVYVCKSLTRKNVIGIQLYSFDKEITVFYKGIMSLAIILCHFSMYVGSSVPLSGRLAAMGFPIVTIFFFISGYGVMTSYEKKGSKYLQSIVTRKIPRLLVPLILLSILSVVLYLRYDSEELSISHILNQFLHDSPFLPFSWFVYALLLLYLVFIIFFKLVKNRLLSILMIASFILAFIYFTTIHGIFLYWRVTIFGFLLGIIFQTIEKYCFVNYTIKPYYYLLLLTFLIFIDLYVIYGFKSIGKVEEPESFVGQSLFIVTPLIVAISSYSLHNILLRNRFVMKLGEISYEMYLFHGIIVGHSLYVGNSVLVKFISAYTLIIVGAYLLRQSTSIIFKVFNI